MLRSLLFVSHKLILLLRFVSRFYSLSWKYIWIQISTVALSALHTSQRCYTESYEEYELWVGSMNLQDWGFQSKFRYHIMNNLYYSHALTAQTFLFVLMFWFVRAKAKVLYKFQQNLLKIVVHQMPQFLHVSVLKS